MNFTLVFKMTLSMLCLCLVNCQSNQDQIGSKSTQIQQSKRQNIFGLEVHKTILLGSQKIIICQGSVIDFEGHAIVNAADNGGIGGGGVDGAINTAGGSELIKARKQFKIESSGDRIPTGTAKTTHGRFGNLKTKGVIHATGPDYSLVEEAAGNKLLEQTYEASLKQAKQYQYQTVAFSLLSAGIFAGAVPLNQVLKIGIDTLKENLPKYPKIEAVYMVAFTQEELAALMNL